MSKSISHVAIIMDGNGRWAKQKFRPRIFGHIKGSGIVSGITSFASDYGLKALTLYAFSTENWSRPEQEVTVLFKLLKKFLQKEKDTILVNNIQFAIIGNIEKLDLETQSLITKLTNETKNATGLKLSFAFSYGGRQEIIDSVNLFIKNNPGKNISEDEISNNLYRPEAGDVDLLIRTGGDQRISNFLLWQVSYGELFFTKTMWPDFTKEEFQEILVKVEGRDRRFGSLDNSGTIDKTKKLVSENIKKEFS